MLLYIIYYYRDTEVLPHTEYLEKPEKKCFIYAIATNVDTMEKLVKQCNASGYSYYIITVNADKVTDTRIGH